ncbi:MULTISPECIES: ribonuclease [Burkholderia]|uniref:Ribonuclease n=2 Tax=Burkholderia humptydooensis TaxID=430531 RepID=A0A7U4SQK3_9BURK|nr:MULTISPECIES: ribonuclease [Burkholderia]AGK47202.1 ribonuclease family protein [Burkholderia thailandensis MSMB121]ATF35836.1 ribonuclease [Burkholderia thailandensis]AJY41647.1 ribonuclease family protein [Burkholderia sp. 2002721687]ALX41511.1 ribonuclease [Burkholderia humptydooensis]EIP88132.1 ribonuclease SA [Burkholderia humptydooensis MSMB43]
MARKWLRNGALASVFAIVAIVAIGNIGASPGSLVSAAYAREAAAANGAAAQVDTLPASRLPREAASTLSLIAAGGPYPYEKDGAVFGNYERILPKMRRGYYHEYTVPTPRARNRGARRIVCGGPLRRVDNCYYTDDHYNSFKRIVD